MSLKLRHLLKPFFAARTCFMYLKKIRRRTQLFQRAVQPLHVRMCRGDRKNQFKKQQFASVPDRVFPVVHEHSRKRDCGFHALRVPNFRLST